jgi:hypothetical protein
MTEVPQQVTLNRACVVCGSTQLRPEEKQLTEKKRPKFGFLWLIGSIFTGGIVFLLWLIWPRHKVTIGVDRWVTCKSCGARQP